MRQGEYISDHREKAGTKSPKYSAEGNITPGTPVSEQYLLDLEARSLQIPMRRKEDAGENSIHAKDRQDIKN